MVTLAVSILWDHFHQQFDREKQKKMISCLLTAAALWAESKWQEYIWIKVWSSASFSSNTYPQPHFEGIRIHAHADQPDPDFHVIYSFKFPGNTACRWTYTKARSRNPFWKIRICCKRTGILLSQESLFLLVFKYASPPPALVLDSILYHQQHTAPFQGDQSHRTANP